MNLLIFILKTNQEIDCFENYETKISVIWKDFIPFHKFKLKNFCTFQTYLWSILCTEQSTKTIISFQNICNSIWKLFLSFHTCWTMWHEPKCSHINLIIKMWKHGNASLQKHSSTSGLVGKWLYELYLKLMTNCVH